MESALPGGYVDFSRFAHLRAKARSDQGAAFEQVVDEFEALFIDLMLKAARDAQIENDLFNSNDMQTYREMFDQQIALAMARNHDFGIGEAIARQRHAAVPDTAGRHDSRGHPVPGQIRALSVSQRAHRGRDADTHEATPEPRSQVRRFVEEMAPHARDAAERLGVSPRALVAQAALESGWGAHVIRNPDGSSTHNYFGIKATPAWHGEVAYAQTTEYIAGRAVSTRAAFRTYPDVAHAFTDYVEFLQQNPRYRGALDMGSDGERFVRELGRAGYATDPGYAEKIVAILQRETGVIDAAARRAP